MMSISMILLWCWYGKKLDNQILYLLYHNSIEWSWWCLSNSPSHYNRRIMYCFTRLAIFIYILLQSSLSSISLITSWMMKHFIFVSSSCSIVKPKSFLEECHLQSNKWLEMFISCTIRSWGYYGQLRSADP